MTGIHRHCSLNRYLVSTNTRNPWSIRPRIYAHSPKKKGGGRKVLILIPHCLPPPWPSGSHNLPPDKENLPMAAHRGRRQHQFRWGSKILYHPKGRHKGPAQEPGSNPEKRWKGLEESPLTRGRKWMAHTDISLRTRFLTWSRWESLKRGRTMNRRIPTFLSKDQNCNPIQEGVPYGSSTRVAGRWDLRYCPQKWHVFLRDDAPRAERSRVWGMGRQDLFLTAFFHGHVHRTIHGLVILKMLPPHQ